ncbi:MAG: YidC/Oxa1 family membrane protein insertase [Treponema sp.]|jgi:YidC/Oxa1 family membrane protein insertase|nr:YidC/Oxa1 family membrane protein insertase [Treponema sp.]
MMNILYQLVVFPPALLIEMAFLFVYRVFDNTGVAILGVSGALCVLTLPLYLAAEKHEEAERNLQKRLKPKLDKIKAVFRGDERYMVLSAYYRQNHYHPVYAMRSSLSLLIQVPFFIAAYSFLSRLEILRGESFLFIGDLYEPDRLIPLRGGVNLLPILMTLINCAASLVYTKGLGLKDKIQLYGMAGIFLLLLYNSPSGLVLYWTANNVFSLIKNILARTKKSALIVSVLSCGAAAFVGVFVLFFHSGAPSKRVAVFALSAAVFVPMFRSLLLRRPCPAGLQIQTPSGSDRRSGLIQARPGWVDGDLAPGTFFLSAGILFLLAGLVIPAGLIASSTADFSFIEAHESPFHFIAVVFAQAAGLFLFWPAVVYFFCSSRGRRLCSFVIVLLSGLALTDVFVFPGNYGFLTVTLSFFGALEAMYDRPAILLNLGTLLLVLGALVLALKFSRKQIFNSLQLITVAALLGQGILSIGGIHREFKLLKEARATAGETESINPVYHLSKTGKNVILVILDRAISAYVPEIFRENPALYSRFSGFTWYPNCVSFGAWTTPGGPPILGGYEYTPEEINRRPDVPWVTKVNDAFFVQPRIFADAGFSVTVTDYFFDSPTENGEFWERLKTAPYMTFEKLDGRYTARWLLRHPEVKLLSITDLLEKNLVCFSFFRINPILLRPLIYDNGYYLATDNLENKIDSRRKQDNKLAIRTVDHYAALDFLPLLTDFEPARADTFTVIYNQLPHEAAYLQVPGYAPAAEPDGRGSGPFAQEKEFHANTAALLLLGKWFDFLKENGVYDNSRIIVVSDHGDNLQSPFPGNIVLPKGMRVENYNPLLLFKDFGAMKEGGLWQDNRFMTNADVLFLNLSGIVGKAVNPFTGSLLLQRKEGGVAITTAGSWMPKYVLDSGRNDWLRVRDNIFDPANWEEVER